MFEPEPRYVAGWCQVCGFPHVLALTETTLAINRAFENLLISSSRFQWYLFHKTGGKNVIAYLILQTLGVTMVLHVSILLIQFNFANFLDIIACNLSTNLVYFDFDFQNKLSKKYNTL